MVEDDAAIRELLQLHLGLAGFDVEEEANGRSALERARRTRFDLLVLDVMLPGLDGVSVCRALRTAGANVETPILMLTARDSEADTVIGLESGADDYLTKPFGVRELQARVLAVTRRHGRGETVASPADGPAVLAPGLTMDLARREVLMQGEPVELTGRNSTCCITSLAIAASSSAVRGCSKRPGPTTPTPSAPSIPWSAGCARSSSAIHGNRS